MNNAYQTYNEIEVSSEVLTASNHRMVQMLMEKCLQQIQLAKIAVANSDLQNKRKTIAKAGEIVSYLRDCLNFKEPEAQKLAELLDSLYDFMAKNFLQATLRNDISFLDQAHAVLSNIKEGWDGISPDKK